MAVLTEEQRVAKRKRDADYRARLKAANVRANVVEDTIDEVEVEPSADVKVLAESLRLREIVLKTGRGFQVIAPTSFKTGIVARVFRDGTRLITGNGTHMYGGICQHGFVGTKDTTFYEFVGGSFQDGEYGNIHTACHRAIA